jgi:TonB family protein
MKRLYCFLLISILFLAQSINPSRVSSQELQKPEEPAELAEAASITEAAVKLYIEKKYKQALPLARQALEIRQRLLPGNDRGIEFSLRYLADILLASGDLTEAKETYLRLLQGLAQQYRFRGKVDQALPLYLRSLSIHGESSGVKDPYFEKVSDAFSCMLYETQRMDLFKELDAVRERYNPAGTDNTVEAENRVLNGRALSLPKPGYPPEARDRRESGIVVIRVTIDETGRVISANDICQGQTIISAESLKAARQARFTPTKLSGMPVKVIGVIQYRFVAR